MDDRNGEEAAKLVKELAGQFRRLGIERRRARRMAQAEVEAWQAGHQRDDAGMAPYLVLPHAQGWCVTRAFAVTATEVFASRDDAERRAIDLGRRSNSAIVVCDARGRTLRRIDPPSGDGR